MVSRSEVIATYRALLGHDPESEEVIANYMSSLSLEELLRSVISSEEFSWYWRQQFSPNAPKSIWLDGEGGNLGNRALQYLVAEGIRSYAPMATIENVYLPEWGIVSPNPRPATSRSVRTGQNFWIDVAGLGDCLRRSVVDSIILEGFPFNIDHYPPRCTSRKLLGPTAEGTDATGFGSSTLVCNIRASEILKGVHGGYLVLPPNYYRLLAERSGLDLVFFGQLDDDPYCRSLREAFPNAQFVPGRSPQFDFDMLRRSRNIAIAISTFSWLAAWLSEPDKIYMPIGGFYHPMAQEQVWAPIDDPSYEFLLVPIMPDHAAVDLFSEPERFWAQQEIIGTKTQFVSKSQLHNLVARAMAGAPRQPFVGGFDPSFYLENNRDVADQIERRSESALEHYMRIGYRQGRSPLAFAESAYVSAYPDVAMDIAHGRFVSGMHPFTAVGWQKGYRPRPAKRPNRHRDPVPNREPRAYGTIAREVGGERVNPDAIKPARDSQPDIFDALAGWLRRPKTDG